MVPDVLDPYRGRGGGLGTPFRATRFPIVLAATASSAAICASASFKARSIETG